MTETEGLYLRVLTLLLDGIRRGEWPPGAEVPSEDQIRKMLGVSRTTVQNATRMLRNFGFLYGPGGGTTRVASADALELAWEAWAKAEQARGLNRQTLQ